MIVVAAIFVVLIGGGFGYLILQSALAHRHWRGVIASGDTSALHAALLEALETWRAMRPPKEIPPADWRALQSAALVAADGERCRVSLLVEPDIRVVDGDRREVGSAISVAERATVRMVERLLYEIPLARFDAVQVDAHTEYRSADGAPTTECLMTTRVTRDLARTSPWDEGSHIDLLADWEVGRATADGPLDPDANALIGAEDAPITPSHPVPKPPEELAP